MLIVFIKHIKKEKRDLMMYMISGKFNKYNKTNCYIFNKDRKYSGRQMTKVTLT